MHVSLYALLCLTVVLMSSDSSHYHTRKHSLSGAPSRNQCPNISDEIYRDTPMIRQRRNDSIHLDLKNRWLHIPKTGTSYVLTFLSLSCPALPHDLHFSSTGYGTSTAELIRSHSSIIPQYCSLKPGVEVEGHHPLKLHEQLALLRAPDGVFLERYFTMLRDPVERMVSGFNHNHHDCDYCRPNTTLIEYAAMHTQPPHIGPAGCMTKMLLGEDCGRRYPARAGLERAKNILKKFFFVGIKEQWELSICLTHAIYGFRIVGAPMQSQFVHARQSNIPSDKVMKQIAELKEFYKADANGIRPDHYDWVDAELYEYGLELFW
eukprot:CAMPEP_0185040566 /NCGR_PEP_ID=MMETSP1103-20130426/38788_1 /TAXON_ID=36769 /ORGANISM="Paraphysomonas bandaiensis, Strain Caron Lab Isolate" /LENGTH=319 /DNA_ID=CAMNT_0027579927 /DNA_START=31 /DNA_END=987 /DNA_ORIENTATION=-